MDISNPDDSLTIFKSGDLQLKTAFHSSGKMLSAHLGYCCEYPLFLLLSTLGVPYFQRIFIKVELKPQPGGCELVTFRTQNLIILCLLRRALTGMNFGAYAAKWMFWSRMKSCSIFFDAQLFSKQNKTFFIWDQCCHLPDDGSNG